MLEHIEAEAGSLRGASLLVRDFFCINKFIDSFREPALRRPMLAIVGGTNLGKSLLAADVLRRLQAVVGTEGFLEITVEMNEHLDFSDFNVRAHSGVLLDGVGDAFILKRNREALQGRPKASKGAQSATMMYSYTCTLCRRAVVATFDLSAKNLDALREDHWLKDPRNVVQLLLDEKVYDDTAPVPSPPPALPAHSVSKWFRL